MDPVGAEEGGDGLGIVQGSECAGKNLYDELSLRLDSAATCGMHLPMFTPYAHRLESSSLSGSASNLRSGLRCSGNDTCSVVQELTVNNCGISDAAAAASGSLDVSFSDPGRHTKKSHWQHLYKLTGRSRSQLSEKLSSDQGHIVLDAREGLKRMSSDNHNLNLPSSHRCSRDPEEVSAQLMNGYNKIMSSSSLPQETLRRKALVSPHLAQAFAAKVTKGKGVINSEQTKFVASSVECRDVELTAELGKLSNEPGKMNECSSLQIERSTPLYSKKHVILRNCLKPGRYKLNQIESLNIFRKILELVDGAHSQGFILGKLRPSYFNLEFPNSVKYTGPLLITTEQSLPKKRPFADDLFACQNLCPKQQKIEMEPSSFQSRCDFRNNSENGTAADVSRFGKILNQKFSDDQTKTSSSKRLSSFCSSMEEQWYSSPEELNGMGCTFSSNTYALGVLFFEFFCCSKTPELLSVAMMNLRNRVLPPTLLSKYPKEVGFCLWLLHPDASLRPSVREILVSDVFCQPQIMTAAEVANLPVEDASSPSTGIEDVESELLLHFLMTLKEQKESHALKLRQKLKFLDTDIKDVERRNVQRLLLLFPENGSVACPNGVHGFLSRPSSVSESKLFVKDKQLEDAYFSVRSKMQRNESVFERPDKDVLKGANKWLQQRQDYECSSIKDNPHDDMGEFFEGLCKYATYNKLEERGTLRSGDLLNSPNVVCSIAFDRDEDFIATAWVSKKIKIFGFDSLLNKSTDIHYPVAEMSNKSMLSCVCWNSYIKNYLASTDYDGTVQLWDADTSQPFSQYSEHHKRGWSVDFSKVDPRKFATGSDDYLVKIWSINERNSTITIRNPANICCVQFSPSSANLVAFGSADYKLYCYDLRHTRIPWCILPDHERTVSHVKFLDSDSLVSASTDNTLKLWDLKKTSPTGLSSKSCSLTYKGHSNQKNFVGLSVLDGYIACGSETNEVFTYYKSLPMPITSYKFSSFDPISGHKMSDDHSQFVSSVCWSRKSNMILAANSKGNIKLLQMTRETT